MNARNKQIYSYARKLRSGGYSLVGEGCAVFRSVDLDLDDDPLVFETVFLGRCKFAFECLNPTEEESAHYIVYQQHIFPVERYEWQTPCDGAEIARAVMKVRVPLNLFGSGAVTESQRQIVAIFHFDPL